MAILKMLNSRPFNGNMVSPPAIPRIDMKEVAHAEQEEDKAPPKTPPKLIRLFVTLLAEARIL